MRVPFIAAWAKPNPANPHQKKLPIPRGEIQPQVAFGHRTCSRPSSSSSEPPPPPVTPSTDRRSKCFSPGKADSSRPEQFLMHYPHGPHRSNYFTVWRDGDWKVIYHTLPEKPTSGGHIQFEGGHYQLFNLADDPFESTNLADTHPGQLKRMMEGLIAQLKSHNAVYPVSDDGAPLPPRMP